MDERGRSLFESCVQIEQGIEPSQSVNQLPHCKGVILFADAADTPILLLTAADIKRLALNRLTCADAAVATKRVKLAEIVGKIYYLCCWCDFNSGLQHYYIARQLFPSRYTDFVTFAKIWYVKINLAAKWPYFGITDNPQTSNETPVFGPFPSRKAAGDYIDSLNEAFALCRQQCLIDNPAKAASCPYYQMHLCGAPCVGQTSRDEYLARIHDSVAAAGGDRKEYVKKFEDAMRTLSAKMEFEQAQLVKKQLEQLKALEDDAYKWVCDIRRLTLLHIDAGPKIKIKGQKKKTQTYVAFLVHAGYIDRLENFAIDQIPQLLESIPAAVSRLACDTSTQNIAEQMSLVGFALYRSKPSGLWMDCRKMPTAVELADVLLKQPVDDSAGANEDVGGEKN